MTKRVEVSTSKNIWFDTQKVDDSDLTLEQDHNASTSAAIINNHIGTGIVPETLNPVVIFDSSLHVGLLDGIAIPAQNQPTNNNLGAQLEISLTNSEARGLKKIKVGIIGLDFEGNLQFETFSFRKNEKQVGKKHFTNILVLLFNDFIGDPNLSHNLGGKIVIKEAQGMLLSRDTKVISQDVQPNLFFRDFFVDSAFSLNGILQNALPTYNIDTLNIHTAVRDNKVLANGDVVTHYGQKFKATTNNIQKITTLLSVRNLGINPNDLVWNGDLILTVYKLQTTVTNPLDIIPNLDIEFQPNSVPIAQVSVDFVSLKNNGIVLDNTPQPVDFILSNSPIAGGNVLEVGSYYAFTLKRSGAANKCDILIAVGDSHLDDSRVTAFTGTVWVDIPEEDLWFQIWSDSAKVSDGQAYDTGHGIQIEKTTIDPVTQATIDHSFGNLDFVGNDVYHAMLSAKQKNSTPIPSEITGNPVNSRQQMVPQIDMLNTIALSNIDSASEPLLLGAISDKNIKYHDSISEQIRAHLRSATVVGDNILIKVIDDATDTGRYDTDVNELVASLLNGNLVSAKITPNSGSPSIFYRIAQAELCNMIVGDVNGDGIVDKTDLDLLGIYNGFNLNVSPPLTTSITTTGNIVDGYNTTFVNGYSTITSPFANEFSLSIQLVRKTDGYVIAESLEDVVIIADPNNSSLAQLTASSIQFNNIETLSNYSIVVTNSTVENNNGGFDIVSVQTATDVLTIKKILLTKESIEAMFRADIDGDFVVSDDDGYLLSEYISNNTDTLSSTSTYPRPATNAYTKIGTTFNVIRLKLEKFEDRQDDYSDSIGSGRPDNVHAPVDLYLSDGYFHSHDFYTNPSLISFDKRLVWHDDLVVVNSKPKLLPSVFTTTSGDTHYECDVNGLNCLIYPQQPNFDKGRVDYFVPDNLIIGSGMKNPDGSDYKVDFEVATVTIEVPDGLFGTERTINLIQDFIAEYEGKGVTKLGYPAMRFADCSYVQQNALNNDQIRFAVAVQSYSPVVDGLSTDGYEGAIVDGKMGVYVDHDNGLLTVNFSHLYEDETLPTLSTKIQVTVFIKKAGFNNKPKFIDSQKTTNLLSLISVFSGANVGGVSALVDVEEDITGILPILHGGTGLNNVGTTGTVLTSNGSGLSYSFVYDLVGVIPYSDGIPDANRVPKTDGYGKLSSSFIYKQDLSLYALAGIASNDSFVPMVIGAIKCRFDEYLLEGLDSIKLEVILENQLPNGAPSNPAKISLFDVTNQTYLQLDSGNIYISTSNEYPTVVQSEDIKSVLNKGAEDYIYEVHLYLTSEPDTIEDPTDTDQAICKGARLVFKYNNPYAVSPPIANEYNFHPNPPTF